MSFIYFFIKKIYNYSFNIWKPLSIISLYLGRISAFEVGFLPGINYIYNNYKKLSLLYLCGTDNINNFNDNSFIVYQGFIKPNNNLYSKINLILPISTYAERKSSYLNIEGRVRVMQKVITAFKFIFNDFEIIRALFFIKRNYIISNFSKIPKFYELMSFFNFTINYINLWFNFNNIHNYFFEISGINLNKKYIFNINDFIYLYSYLGSNNFFDGFFINSLLNRTINNYYASDFFVKNSKIMSITAMRIMPLNFS